MFGPDGSIPKDGGMSQIIRGLPAIGSGTLRLYKCEQLMRRLIELKLGPDDVKGGLRHLWVRYKPKGRFWDRNHRGFGIESNIYHTVK